MHRQNVATAATAAADAAPAARPADWAACGTSDYTDGAVAPVDEGVSKNLLRIVCENWSSVRMSTVIGHVQRRYNFRLTGLKTCSLEGRLRGMFEVQTHAFKINKSFGFVL